jgi:hypothetical protein
MAVSREMGATTIWERWDGIKPDSTLKHLYEFFQPLFLWSYWRLMYRSVSG